MEPPLLDSILGALASRSALEDAHGRRAVAQAVQRAERFELCLGMVVSGEERFGEAMR